MLSPCHASIGFLASLSFYFHGMVVAAAAAVVVYDRQGCLSCYGSVPDATFTKLPFSSFSSVPPIPIFSIVILIWRLMLWVLLFLLLFPVCATKMSWVLLCRGRY